MDYYKHQTEDGIFGAFKEVSPGVYVEVVSLETGSTTPGSNAGAPVQLPAVTLDASARVRTGSLATLFDGKTIHADTGLLWDEKGTGTGLFEAAANKMTVAAGQYLIRQSRQACPYFSGKSQLVEITFDAFAPQANALAWLGMGIDDAPDQYVLAYMPLTATQPVNGSIQLREF